VYTGTEGVQVTGNTIAFNDGFGVFVSSSSTQIKGNAIHDNGGPGVRVPGWEAQIEGNSIYGNAGLGIDLNGSGVPILNDSLGNDFQNFPILAAAQTGSGLLLSGTLNSTARTTFTLDFYASPTVDASDLYQGQYYGEGQYFLGSRQVTTDSSGNVTFATDFSAADLAATQLPNSLVPNGWYISATATDAGGNTSEFGPDVQVSASNALQPVLTFGATVTIVAANNDQAQDVLAAGNTLSAQTPA